MNAWQLQLEVSLRETMYRFLTALSWGARNLSDSQCRKSTQVRGLTPEDRSMLPGVLLDHQPMIAQRL